MTILKSVEYKRIHFLVTKMSFILYHSIRVLLFLHQNCDMFKIQISKLKKKGSQYRKIHLINEKQNPKIWGEPREQALTKNVWKYLRSYSFAIFSQLQLTIFSKHINEERPAKSLKDKQRQTYFLLHKVLISTDPLKLRIFKIIKMVNYPNQQVRHKFTAFYCQCFKSIRINSNTCFLNLRFLNFTENPLCSQMYT